MGTGLAEASVLHLPTTWCQIERVTRSSKFSKSTSLQRSANNSLTRSPVAASRSANVRSRTANLLRSNWSSQSSSTSGAFSRFALWRTSLIGFVPVRVRDPAELRDSTNEFRRLGNRNSQQEVEQS